MTGNFPGGGPFPPAFGPGYPVSQPPKPSRAGVWLGAIACVLATAALVVGVMALVTVRREHAPAEKQEVPQAEPHELRLAEKQEVPQAEPHELRLVEKQQVP